MILLFDAFSSYSGELLLLLVALEREYGLGQVSSLELVHEQCHYVLFFVFLIVLFYSFCDPEKLLLGSPEAFDVVAEAGPVDLIDLGLLAAALHTCFEGDFVYDFVGSYYGKFS